MALIDLFDSGDKKRRLSHIRNLVGLAASDGELDKAELDLIFRVGARVGLSSQELLRIVQRPNSISFRAPNNFAERIEQLYDMVLVMLIDGDVHQNEVALCKLTAIRLGFREQIIERLVLDVINMVAKGIAMDIVLSNLKNEYS